MARKPTQKSATPAAPSGDHPPRERIIEAAGPRGMVRAQGLAVLFASVLRTWVDDDDPGLARTMAALDRALARGQRWSGFLDGLSRIPQCVGRARRRRPRDADDEETV